MTISNDNTQYFKDTRLEEYLKDEKFIGMDVLEGTVVVVDDRDASGFMKYHSLNVRILMGDQLEESEKNIRFHFRGLSLKVYHENESPFQGLFLGRLEDLTDRKCLGYGGNNLIERLIDYQQRTGIPLTIIYAHGSAIEERKKHYITVRDKDYDTETVLQEYVARFFPDSKLPPPVMLVSCNEIEGYKHEFQDPLPVALLYRKGTCGRGHITGELATNLK